MASGTTALNEDGGQLLDLPLGTGKGAKSLLGHLAGLLVLAVLQQLHNALLVRSEARDLTNEAADKLDTLAELLKGYVSIWDVRTGWMEEEVWGGQVHLSTHTTKTLYNDGS